MKKPVLLLALLAGTSVAATAQTTTKFGIKAGGNYTKFSGKDERYFGNTEYKFGVVGGLAANIGFSESLSLQPELLYSMKGAEIKGAVSPFQNDDNYKLNYVELPVLFRYTLNDGNGPFIQAGPQVSYLINSKISDGDGKEIKNNRGDFQKVEAGYVAAIGYQSAMGLSIEARYNGGINSIGKDDNYLDKVRNRAISLQLGYMFGGK